MDSSGRMRGDPQTPDATTCTTPPMSPNSGTTIRRRKCALVVIVGAGKNPISSEDFMELRDALRRLGFFTVCCHNLGTCLGPSLLPSSTVLWQSLSAFALAGLGMDDHLVVYIACVCSSVQKRVTFTVARHETAGDAAVEDLPVEELLRCMKETGAGRRFLLVDVLPRSTLAHPEGTLEEACKEGQVSWTSIGVNGDVLAAFLSAARIMLLGEERARLMDGELRMDTLHSRRTTRILKNVLRAGRGRCATRKNKSMLPVTSLHVQKSEESDSQPAVPVVDSPNASHEDEETSIPSPHSASHEGQSSMVKSRTFIKMKAFDAKPVMKGMPSPSWTYPHLIDAVAAGDHSAVQEMLAQGANVHENEMYIFDETPLHVAVRKGDLALVKLLFEHGGSVNAGAGPTLDRPLHVAAFCGHVPIAQFLLEYGADVSATNQGGWTALHEAASRGHLDMTEILLDNAANIDVTNPSGWTPLHRAAFYGRAEEVELLLDMGADRGFRKWSREKWIHVATHRDQKAVLACLQEEGIGTRGDITGSTSPRNPSAALAELLASMSAVTDEEQLRLTVQRSFFVGSPSDPSHNFSFSEITPFLRKGPETPRSSTDKYSNWEKDEARSLDDFLGEMVEEEDAAEMDFSAMTPRDEPTYAQRAPTPPDDSSEESSNEARPFEAPSPEPVKPVSPPACSRVPPLALPEPQEPPSPIRPPAVLDQEVGPSSSSPRKRGQGAGHASLRHKARADAAHPAPKLPPSGSPRSPKSPKDNKFVDPIRAIPKPPVVPPPSAPVRLIPKPPPGRPTVPHPPPHPPLPPSSEESTNKNNPAPHLPMFVGKPFTMEDLEQSLGDQVTEEHVTPDPNEAEFWKYSDPESPPPATDSPLRSVSTAADPSPSRPVARKELPANVFTWLDSLGLGAYLPAFQAQGYDDIRVIGSMDPDDVSDMITCVNRLKPILPGHEIKLKKSIEKLHVDGGPRSSAFALAPRRMRSDVQGGSKTIDAEVAIGDWLANNALPRKYAESIVRCGYSVTTSLQRASEEEIEAMIARVQREEDMPVGHAQKLRNRIAKLRNPKAEASTPSKVKGVKGTLRSFSHNLVLQWLEEIGLRRYGDAFLATHHSNLQELMGLNDDDLGKVFRDVEVYLGEPIPPSHRSRLLNRITKRRAGETK